MAVQSSGTLSISRKRKSSESLSDNVVNPVTYASFRSSDDSDSTFMELQKYCRMCYDTSRATLQCSHIADPRRFVVSRNRNYQSRFGAEGDFTTVKPSGPTRPVTQQETTTHQTPCNQNGIRKNIFLCHNLTRRCLFREDEIRPHQQTNLKTTPGELYLPLQTRRLYRETKDGGYRGGSPWT